MSDLQRTNYIEKDATNYIKGIAMILMFVHHFFTFPEWYISGISYPYLSVFAKYMCAPLKICVPIFAFLTGYFYYYSKNKTIRYSIKKITDVWLSYVVVFLVLLIPAVILGVYNFSVKNFILEFFALKRPVMFFCWYVIFYFTIMLILPLYAKLSKKAPCLCFLLTFAVSMAITVAFAKVKALNNDNTIIFLQFIKNLSWFPCVSAGYLFAEYGFFNEFSNFFKTKNRILRILIGLAFIVFSAFSVFFNCPDFIRASLFIFGIMEIYHSTKHKIIYKPLVVIGKYSLTMWFLHCIFFNVCKEYTQPILYFVREPIAVTLWGLLICLLAAVILQFPINALLKLKNNIFKLNRN